MHQSGLIPAGTAAARYSHPLLVSLPLLAWTVSLNVPWLLAVKTATAVLHPAASSGALMSQVSRSSGTITLHGLAEQNLSSC